MCVRDVYQHDDQQETIAVEASQATLPALLSQMHAHVLKAIRECMSDDG
jgi:hypothetical protein